NLLLRPSTLNSSFLTATTTTELYTLSLHDALPISQHRRRQATPARVRRARGVARRQEGRVSGGRRPHVLHRRSRGGRGHRARPRDRKSTRLNSSHVKISYAVFCLKKKKVQLRISDS